MGTTRHTTVSGWREALGDKHRRFIANRSATARHHAALRPAQGMKATVCGDTYLADAILRDEKVAPAVGERDVCGVEEGEGANPREDQVLEDLSPHCNPSAQPQPLPMRFKVLSSRNNEPSQTATPVERARGHDTHVAAGQVPGSAAAGAEHSPVLRQQRQSNQERCSERKSHSLQVRGERKRTSGGANAKNRRGRECILAVVPPQPATIPHPGKMRRQRCRPERQKWHHTLKCTDGGGGATGAGGRSADSSSTVRRPRRQRRLPWLKFSVVA